MPRINANRDSVDDRFSVLGFTVRTESPLYEIAVATDPALFRADARARRARRNFFSSRAQGALRARRGEAVYLLPQDVLANFVGSPRLYFGLATYREGSTAKPDFVQLPSEGNMYVGLGGLTERGLRRAVSPLTPSSYGTTPGRDPSLDWGGDALAQPGPAAPATAAGGAAAPRHNGAAQVQAPAAAAALEYDDGFGAFPSPAPAPADAHAATAVAAQEVLMRSFDGDLASQLRLFAETVQWVAGVEDTTKFPHSAICKVEIWKNHVLQGYATAFYVGRRMLLTNAHVVNDGDTLVVIPGKNGAGTSRAEEPFGRFTCTQMRAHERYNGGRDFDMAVVLATQDAPNGKWLTPIEELRQSRPEGVGVCGYSAHSRRTDLPGTIVNAVLNPDKQHVHRGFVRTISDENFQYDVQELAGSSGSPVYWIEAGSPPRAHVVGINAGPRDAVTNEGCRFTDAKVAWIRARAAEWHQSAAMALDDESGADTAVQAQDVPLEPAGGGGRSISTAALQPGDIILETANAVVSYAIRAGTMSAASHVMLYAGNGRIIDAVGAGVRDVTIEEGLSHAMLAVAFRHPRMTPEIAQRIVAYARSQVGSHYNYAGVAGAGVRIVAPFPASVVDGIARRLHREVGQAGAVYCSELVMDAYARNGLPLTSIDPARSTPQDVVSFATSNLQYVGHLIAEDTGWLGAQLHFPARMLAVDDDGDTPVTAQELMEQSYDGTLESQIRLFGQSVEWIAGVPDTRGFPHSAICFVGDIQRGPEVPFGSAFFIGKHLLLTAGHVVDGMSRLVIVPGKNGLGMDAAHEPFGRFEVALTAANCFKYPGFAATTGTDMALIYTGPGHSAPNDRWFNIVEELRQSRPEGVGVCGYSVSSNHSGWLPQLVNTLNDPRKQHLHRGYVRTLPGNDLFTYDVQTLPGASGSPVYWVEAGSPPRVHCVGVHIAGDSATSNRGCRMTDAKVAWLRAKAATFGEAHAFALEDEDGGYSVAAEAAPDAAPDPGTRRPRLAPPPAPVVQQPLGVDEPVAAPTTETVAIASTVAGATMQRVTVRSAQAELRLEQLRGLKHPGDHPPAQPRALQDATPLRLADWPTIAGASGGVTAAPVEIRWQYDGVSLGNVQVGATPTVAPGAGLRVTARILDDAVVYPRSAPAFAALRVRLDYAFEHGGQHPIRAFHDVHLFGNGRCNVAGDWHHHEPGAEANALDAGAGSGSGATAAAPRLTLSWEAGNPGRAAWTRELVAAIVAHKAQLDRGNPDAFIPGYAALSSDLQVKFWAELLVAIAKWESGWNPADSYMEASGEASVGLLALSYTDANSYPLQGLDRAHDTLKDPLVNLRAGVVILATLVGRDGAVTGSTTSGGSVAWKGAARYWSTMRTERKHLADIRQRVRDAVGLRP